MNPVNASIPETATPERILRRLEWQVIRRLDGILQGDFRTLFYGHGIDFADLREYQPHDDVRHIDWNVTARTQVPHVRVYNEDRDVTAWFLLDLSPSVDFGSTEITKRQVLTEFTNLLYGGRITDMETCYKIMERDVALSLNLESNRFDIEPEITAKLLRSGHKILELPIHFNPRSRAQGKKIGWRDGVRAIEVLVKYRFSK